MTKPSYRQQFDKLTEVYFNGEISPFNPCNCFVGNLLNNSFGWIHGRYLKSPGCVTSDNAKYLVAQESIDLNSGGLYTVEDVIALEEVFLRNLEAVGSISEDELFNAFDDALDYLAQIHESKGEVIDGDTVFQKRELVNA